MIREFNFWIQSYYNFILIMLIMWQTISCEIITPAFRESVVGPGVVEEPLDLDGLQKSALVSPVEGVIGRAVVPEKYFFFIFEWIESR